MIDFIQMYNLDIDQFEHIVPVPLHPTRLRERTYNQSELLARRVSQYFRKELSLNNLVRIRHTQNQASLAKKNRWTNIEGAFTIKNSKAFSNQSILLIDDLLTTGATVSEAAKELKRAGAKKVGVFTLATVEQR